MAWSAPRTWTNGDVPTGAMMNTEVRDNELFLRTFHGARMWESAAENQTTSGSLQLIQWDTTDYDTDSFAVLGSEWFIVPTGFGGYYRITASIGWSANATGLTRTTVIKKNETYVGRVPNAVGTTLDTMSPLNSGAGLLATPAIWTGPLVAGDHITVEGTQNSGGTLALSVGKDTCWFECHYLGS